ncbi:hypothetical protein H206_06174 [Candidatus Electrothrix aarhusensis]|uniref:Uncharacterized protein n=1 Tax=Candidatus Electrothrix aarhusensis TaxID=1859131 RepID=A0A444J391_9BACT|nr:hypothetical protein H206_06174 [Candidatus Electrothrix aarhusensis]
MLSSFTYLSIEKSPPSFPHSSCIQKHPEVKQFLFCLQQN